MRIALRAAIGAFIGFGSVAQADISEWTRQAALRCAPAEHPVVEQSDFRWGLNFFEAADLFQQLYKSEKRLFNRFYHEEGKGFLGLYFNPSNSKEPLSVPARFLYSIKRHIETALSLEYVQWAFFPDMGHNHFFIEQEEYDSWAGSSNRQMMTNFMNSPKTKMLYHTLEQIKVTNEDKTLYSDAWSQWRYYTRNIVGDNQGLGTLEIHKNLKGNYNTVGKYEGHRYWGAGIYLHSNQDGCFSYEHKGKTFYFDVTFFSLPYNGFDNASSDEYGVE